MQLSRVRVVEFPAAEKTWENNNSCHLMCRLCNRKQSTMCAMQYQQTDSAEEDNTTHCIAWENNLQLMLTPHNFYSGRLTKCSIVVIWGQEGVSDWGRQRWQWYVGWQSVLAVTAFTIRSTGHLVNSGSKNFWCNWGVSLVRGILWAAVPLPVLLCCVALWSVVTWSCHLSCTCTGRCTTILAFKCRA